VGRKRKKKKDEKSEVRWTICTPVGILYGDVGDTKTTEKIGGKNTLGTVR
jgi:hypothetical protein